MYPDTDYTAVIQEIQQAGNIPKIQDVEIKVNAESGNTFVDISISSPGFGKRRFRLDSQPFQISRIMIGYVQSLGQLQDFELERRWNALCFRASITPYACRQTEEGLLVVFDPSNAGLSRECMKSLMQDHRLQLVKDMSRNKDMFPSWLIASL